MKNVIVFVFLVSCAPPADEAIERFKEIDKQHQLLIDSLNKKIGNELNDDEYEELSIQEKAELLKNRIDSIKQKTFEVTISPDSTLRQLSPRKLSK